ncbi:cyclic nucleotide-binding protein [Streptomyces sp. SLBN-118]|uniref:Crp/Fnr family transcriptional regulator n=1 Tax=Streptomyces sp. SLBN-118 TaxID=2768454 RepID=UPI001153A96A|nr:cyclic nucleotide-binding domain-containing protein [Streptomyces sp. SLBN-118]TQK50027.1 cyclic nucleotide-binding protein [Streptomyces sp. SLBN-118]
MNTTTMMRAMPAEHRNQLLRIAREVNFPQGTRIFEEGRRADRFWIIRSGTVTLDMHVPGRPAAIIENLGLDELVGCSWLFPPHTWQLGAQATSPVRAYEFDATAVRLMCETDPELRAAVAQWVGQVIAHRLQAARTRLLDLYAPYGSGSPR